MAGQNLLTIFVALTAVAVRLRSGEDLKSKPIDEFLAIAREAITSKK